MTDSSVEAVARAICKAMGDHWFGSAAYERYNERWKKVAVAAIAALPSPEREPLREALASVRQRLVNAAEHQCTKRGDYLYKGHPDSWIADSINEIDALLAPPSAQSGDRT